MRRLLRASLKERQKKKGKSSGKDDSDDDIVDKDGKIAFDRRQFDLDTYIDILHSLHNITLKPEEKKKANSDADKFKIERKEPD